MIQLYNILLIFLIEIIAYKKHFSKFILQLKNIAYLNTSNSYLHKK